MSERAVILVPRWGALTRNRHRDILAAELSEADRNRVERVEDGAIDGETFKRLVPVAGIGPERPAVDLYEVAWADLAVPERAAGPVGNFLEATGLVLYWFAHPWWIRSLRVSRAMPFGIALSGLLVLGWYLVAIVALAHFVLELPSDAIGAEAAAPGASPGADATGAGTAPAIPAEGSLAALAEMVGGFLSAPAEWLVRVTSHPWFAILLAILALLPTLRIAALAAFARYYLTTGSVRGFHGDLIQRVQVTLDRVYRQRSAVDPDRPRYDEVVLLGHSMGAVIALEALAGYEDPAVQERTTLVTWGSPIAILANRSRRLADALDRAVASSIRRWIDVYSTADLFCAPIARQAAHYRDASVNIRFDLAWWNGHAVGVHDQYFYHPTSLDDLLAPISEKGTALPETAGPDPEPRPVTALSGPSFP